jgi:hypothetical protein
MRSRLVLSLAERDRLVVALDRALAELLVVEEHLWVAQQRTGTVLGAPTADALEDARAGLSELRGRVLRTPLSAD